MGEDRGMEKKIAVYLRNKKINPSGYYRIYQYFREMNMPNIQYRELVPDFVYMKYHFKSNWFYKIMYSSVIIVKSFFDLIRDVLFYKPDIVVINREICPKFQTGVHYLLEKKLLRKSYVIWDFDDAISINGEISKQEWKLLENESDRIVVLSSYLKSSISEQNWYKVDFLPTTDGDYIKKEFQDEAIRRKNYDKEIRMIWLATASNIPYLQMCLPYLEEAAQVLKEEFAKKLVLVCVCNKKLETDTQYLHVENVNWEREKALEIMRDSHIGIMPLNDDQYTRGKGGFKLVQYMSAGIPVIASNVGFNKEVVKKEFGFLATEGTEWCRAVINLATDYDFWKKCSEHARAEWDLNYSYKKVFAYWKDTLK